MYDLHIKDPTFWTVRKLANEYDTEMERVEAILVLKKMEKDKIAKVFSFFLFFFLFFCLFLSLSINQPTNQMKSNRATLLMKSSPASRRHCVDTLHMQPVRSTGTSREKLDLIHHLPRDGVSSARNSSLCLSTFLKRMMSARL
jgi:hypothetical protein